VEQVVARQGHEFLSSAKRTARSSKSSGYTVARFFPDPFAQVGLDRKLMGAFAQGHE
jgi:hypothetical protein